MHSAARARSAPRKDRRTALACPLLPSDGDLTTVCVHHGRIRYTLNFRLPTGMTRLPSNALPEDARTSASRDGCAFWSGEGTLTDDQNPSTRTPTNRSSLCRSGIGLGTAESSGADTASVGRVKPECANDELRTSRLPLRHPVA